MDMEGSPAPAREPGEAREGRGRRRRRGGRDRHERREAGANAQPAPVPYVPRPIVAGAAPIAPEVEAAPVAVVPETVSAEPPSYVAAEDTVQPRVMETPESQPAVFETAQVPPQPEFSAETRQEPSRAAEPVHPLPELKLEWSSDLVQIETDPQKAQGAATAATEEAPAPRPRRVRPATPPISEEPLVQVETRKPDATIGN